jgi:hypothetical protein
MELALLDTPRGDRAFEFHGHNLRVVRGADLEAQRDAALAAVIVHSHILMMTRSLGMLAELRPIDQSGGWLAGPDSEDSQARARNLSDCWTRQRRYVASSDLSQWLKTVAVVSRKIDMGPVQQCISVHQDSTAVGGVVQWNET